VQRKIVHAAAKKMAARKKIVVMRDDMVWRRGALPAARRLCLMLRTFSRKNDLPMADRRGGSVAQVSGRVEGQVLRGSLQQKRKEEGP